MINLLLQRDNNPAQAHNWGTLFVGGVKFGETLEDPDRRLEDGGRKIYGNTAIPRGRYRVEVTFSNRFQKWMPELIGVPQFLGIRIHGGNTEANTDGCPLLGERRTADGVANCKDINQRLIGLLLYAYFNNEEVWIDIK